MDDWDFILPNRSSQRIDQDHKRKRFTESVDELNKTSGELWIDKHKPKTENELCVQVAKVNEVKDAIKHSSIGDQLDPIKILLLSGPTGCGKSTLVQVLSKTLDYELIEWENPVNEYDQDNYVHTMTLFNRFLNSSIRKDTMHVRHGSKDKKIIFVDDIPDITTEEIKKKFHTTLKSCLESTVPFLLIFVVSETWMEKSSGYRSYDERLNQINDIIPKELELDKRVRHIKFKSVSVGNVKRILKNIMDCEQATVSNDQLQDIINQSDGDIRASINHIQFHAKRSIKSNKKPHKPNNSKVIPFHNKIGPLDLFHAVGKVLYAKRNADGTLESKPEHIINKLPVDNDIFISFLHQNALYFFDDIESCSNALDYISIADTLRSESDWQENTSSAYRNLITMHGIMKKPKRKTESKFFTMQKPIVFDIQQRAKKNQSDNYYQQLNRSVENRVELLEQEELKEFEDDPIEDFSEDEFDDLFGDGTDLALLEGF